MTPSKSPLISIVFLFLQFLSIPENFSCAPATTESSSLSMTFDLQPLRSCTSDCQCTKAYGKEARCIGGKCFCLSGSLGAAQKVSQNESSTLTVTTTITSMIAQDCFKLAESRASLVGGSNSSAGNAWSELVSSQREAERYRITWAAVFIFILCAIAAIFHVYQAD